MRQFNLETDRTSPKTSQFTLPADEHFSILVTYKNWDGFNGARFLSTRGLENYEFSTIVYNHVQKTTSVENDNYIGINPANNGLQSYTFIIK